MINKVNVKAAIQYSIVGAVLFAATSTYATTIEFSEDYNGTFTVSGNNFSYDLTTGDGSYPFLASTGSSSLSCDSVVGCTGTGTFVRDEDFGNTFSGTYNYVISTFDFFDEGENEVFNYSINYVGELILPAGQVAMMVQQVQVVLQAQIITTRYVTF